jgi:hypothetical protein
MGRPTIIPTAPSGWNNIASSDSADIQICADLIASSTQNSGLNTNSNSSPVSISRNIKARRAALWLRNDQLVTIAYHSFDGPTSPDYSRSPKFCVCAGIDESLTPLPYPLLATNPVYTSIRDAVAYFATNNQGAARIYLLMGDVQPNPRDWIYPIFQCAINNDIAFTEKELTDGIPERYATQGIHPRWPVNITTWKLKRV